MVGVLVVGVNRAMIRVIWMHGVELDAILAQQFFIVPQATEQLPLRKPSTAARADGDCRHTLSAGLVAIGAGKSAIALYFPLLTQNAGEDPLRFHGALALLRGFGRRHFGATDMKVFGLKIKHADVGSQKVHMGFW